jgi:hypothetical protein
MSPPKDQVIDPQFWGAFLREDQSLLPSPSDPNEESERDERFLGYFCIIGYDFGLCQGKCYAVMI